MKPLVYIAGPYSKPYPVYNTRAAMLLWTKLWQTGKVTPLVPHVSMFMDFLTPLPYPEWLAFDLELIDHCDAVFRMPGESSGADGEVARAVAQGKPIFYDEAALLAWAEAHT